MKKAPATPLATFTVCYRHNGNEYITSIVAHDATAARARFPRANPDCHIAELSDSRPL